MMIRLEIKSCTMILTKNKKAKISPLSTRKTDNYEYLTSEEILPSNQRQTIEEHAKLKYSLLGKVFVKKKKTIEEKAKKINRCYY